MERDAWQWERPEGPKAAFDPETAGDMTAQFPEPIFVVHRHALARRGYDLCLEVGGVLKVWVTPQGPSTDPRVRRVAVEARERPLAHAAFEGAAGERGDAIMVWDFGAYENLTERQGRLLVMEEALAEGHAIFRLHGSKLHGAYSLIRMEGGREETPAWLLVKMRDDDAETGVDVTRTRPESALSASTMKEILDDAMRRAA